MKKLLIIALGLAIVSCNQTTESTGLKTAYVDTDKLVEKYQKAIDLEEKYKVKSEEMGRELDAEAKKFQSDYQFASRQAQVKGPQWAQEKAMEMQQREQQLSMKQQAMYKEIQEQSGAEMDSLVTEIKTFIKDYGKKQGFDYVYGTGNIATVLYAKDQYDITEELTKLLNESYTPNKEAKTTEDKEVKKDDKK
ncbi:OmpH family outer membrane protein [Flavobacterium sp.]|uniref:OmpH family outer membrane protein n=1 Tax=Flavobacterium sp. TaxID=239 RepID=UPI003F6A4374